MSSETTQTTGSHEDHTAAPLESRVRFWSLFRIVVSSSILGLLAAFDVPIQLVLISAAGCIFLVLLIKFIRDNIKLSKRVGAARFFKALCKSTGCFLPFVIILIPGYLIGVQISSWTNQGIEKLQVWSAPDIISEQVQKQIERRVEERIKRNLPFWYVPLVHFGWASDYVTQARTEIATISETVNRAKPKPIHIRAVAGFLKAGLLAVGIYSTAWVALLFMRAYASIFGRILVVGDPPVFFGIGPKPKKKRRNSTAPKEDCTLYDRVASGTKLVVKLEGDECLFVRGSDLPANSMPDISPRWNNGCLALRIRRGLFFMNKVLGGASGCDIGFHASGSYQYISVPLRLDHEVVVDPARVVGFTQDVRFRSHWDFNLALLALGRATSFLAVGPGLLILRCDGQPAVYPDSSNALATSPEQLILFGRDAYFQIIASQGFLNYVAAGCVIKPTKGSLFVAAPLKAKPASFLSKIWALIKQVYIPI